MNDGDQPLIRHVVVGMSGTGKTTLIVSLIRALNPDWLFVYDGRENIAPKLGLQWSYDFDEFEDNLKNQRAVVFNPKINYAGDPLVFDSFNEYVMRVSEVLPGSKLLVIDEIQRYTSPVVPLGHLESIVDGSRQNALWTLLGCQASNTLHTRLKGQLTDCWFFLSTSPNANEYPIQMGVPENELRNLRRFEFIYLNTDSSYWKKAKLLY